MEGEARILKQRVKSPPLKRHRIEALERIGCEQQKREESKRQRCLRTERRGKGALRKPPLGERQPGPSSREHGHPQQH
jgi:hypothetical protein